MSFGSTNRPQILICGIKSSCLAAALGGTGLNNHYYEFDHTLLWYLILT
jgi:hypothetical protein